jgi:hypothetical protein
VYCVHSRKKPAHPILFAVIGPKPATILKLIINMKITILAA